MISIPGTIPIRIHPIFWFLIGIIGWLNSGTMLGTMIWAIVILISVLVHEYGHALTALAFGQTARIELIGLGGVTYRKGGPLKLWQEFIIVLNGPLAGLLLCIAAYFIKQTLGKNSSILLRDTITITVYANLFWTIINLLPIHPLDGGHLLTIILESIFGIRGVKMALLFSSILALFVGLFFFTLQAILAGSLFLLLAFESYRAWKSSLVMSTQDRDEELQKQLKLAQKNDNKEEAIRQLEDIRSKSQKGFIFLTATEHLGNLLYQQGNTQKAYELLHSIQKELSPESLKILHKLAYQKGALREAVSVGEDLYQTYPTYDTAIINAFCYSLLGEVNPAVGWLKRAIADGLPNLKVVLSKEAFDPIRNTPAFLDLSKKI